MATTPEFSRLGFVKTYLLPVFLILLLPLFSLWFFDSAEERFDRDVFASIEKDLHREGKDAPTPEKREEVLNFFREVPVSQIMASDHPDAAKMQEPFADIATDYATFRWMKRLSALCILTSVVAFLLAGLGVLLSFRSQLVQYYSLAAGWHLLKLVSAFQVVAQGVLAVALSYWVTALWMDVYVPKLILVIAFLAIAAVWALLQAIFKKLDTDFTVEGTLVPRQAAGAVWERIDSMARALDIPPPDQIIVGIDDNFFVTEQPVIVQGETCRGRTLFVSLSLLKILEKEEAAAVLAHELAHFSGQDTVYSRKIAPILMRYGEYLQALHDGGISMPVFYFMLFFRSLFELSLRRVGREREFRADATAVSLTSPQALASSLLKVTAYSQYRREIESKMFETEAVLESADISAGIAQGFPAFIARGVSLQALGETGTTHPFDSHPPLGQRLAAVGVPLTESPERIVAMQEVQSSWFHEIPGAEDIEKAQWKEYEDNFRKIHEQSLAFRYLPSTDSEREVVTRYFPEQSIGDTSGGNLILDCERVHHTSWSAPIRFEQMVDCKGEESFGKQYLHIRYLRPGDKDPALEKLNMSALQLGPEQFAAMFGHYYGRFLAARDYQKMVKDAQPVGEA